ncbi:hypothetical protein OG21DRAFT_1518247 [Imleria badia]|nr:hypothetical protein OG21DRAFT_1518247 [Imleria badia]
MRLKSPSRGVVAPDDDDVLYVAIRTPLCLSDRSCTVPYTRNFLPITSLAPKPQTCSRRAHAHVEPTQHIPRLPNALRVIHNALVSDRDPALSCTHTQPT